MTPEINEINPLVGPLGKPIMPLGRRSGPPVVRGTLAAVVRVARDPALALWALYIILFPLYVFPSGLPQPGDLLVLMLAPVVLNKWKGNLFKQAIPPLRALLAFSAYIVLLNLGYSVALNTWAISPKEGFLLTPTFYIYNGLIFTLVVVMYQNYRERLLSVTLNMVLVSVVIQAGLSLVVHRQSGGRDTLLFNNPNQLGFFAVLSACILTFGRRRLGLGTTKATVGLALCAYLALMSASKAALGATGVLIIAGMLNNPRIMILAAGAAIVLILTVDPVQDAFQAAADRLNRPDQQGMLESRGYDRILNHEEYWLFGSGEGYYKRFADTTVIGAHELHSSAGTLFFCYGILGTLLFLRFMWQCLRRSSFRSMLVLLPAAAYGLFHQGLRFTLFWVLLGMYVCLKDVAQRSAAPNLEPRAKR